MKRYFNDTINKQVIMVEFAPNSVIMKMSIPEILGSDIGILEVSKSRYRQKLYEYQKINETNLIMTISH